MTGEGLDNPQTRKGYSLRKVQWDDLRERLNFPRWPGLTGIDFEYLLEGLRPIGERALMAVWLRPLLEPAQFEAMDCDLAVGGRSVGGRGGVEGARP